MILTNKQQEALNNWARQYKIEWFAVVDGVVKDLEFPNRSSAKKIIGELYEGCGEEIPDNEIIETLLVNLEIIDPADIGEEYNNPVIIRL